METEQIYQLLLIMIEYFIPKEKENAISTILNHLYENDCDINELLKCADSDEEQWLSRQIKMFIKENGLDEDEYEEDEEW